MSDKLLDAVMSCAERRVRVRAVPRGSRISFPFPLEGDHLLELTFEDVGRDQYRMTDAGLFFTFLQDHEIGEKSEAVKDALRGLEELGFKVSGLQEEQEIGSQFHIDDIGCAAWDLSTALASSLRSLLREHRTGVVHFEAEIRKKLDPFKKAIVWKQQVHPGITVPIYVPGRSITAVLIGSHGLTVDPADVARRQVFPYYQMLAKRIETKFKRFALVSPTYWQNSDVKQLVKDVGPEVVMTNQLKRFELAIQGTPSEGLAGAT